MDVKKATMAELLEFYNSRSDIVIKRFADRKTAEARCLKLLEKEAGTVPNKNFVPLKTFTEDAAPKKKPAKAKVAKNASNNAENKQPRGDRSTAIAATWADEGVRDARRKRYSVNVKTPTGEVSEFKSLRKALNNYGIVSKSVPSLRAKLRDEGALEVQGYAFLLDQ